MTDVRCEAPPSGLPAISPSRGEIGWPAAFGNDQRRRATQKLPISPLEGEMPGRAEGGVPRHTLRSIA
ncbi:ABC transporter ATP-binding protein, partial [Mesorhizobium sp. M8A.F.Ca.ET.023.02.2.1]